MRLSYSQEHQLRLIEAALQRSDPHLGAMFSLFGRLHPSEGLPAWEQEPSSQDCFQPAARFVAVLTAAAGVISGLLRAVFVLVTPRRCAQGRPRAAEPERTRHCEDAGNQQDPPSGWMTPG